MVIPRLQEPASEGKSGVQRFPYVAGIGVHTPLSMGPTEGQGRVSPPGLGPLDFRATLTSTCVPRASRKFHRNRLRGLGPKSLAVGRGKKNGSGQGGDLVAAGRGPEAREKFASAEVQPGTLPADPGRSLGPPTRASAPRPGQALGQKGILLISPRSQTKLILKK